MASNQRALHRVYAGYVSDIFGHIKISSITLS